jgi:uncharacterized protein (TIGR00288 family)
MLHIAKFPRVALLIDADNFQLNHLEQILKVADYYGDLKICRAYGDWKRPPLSASKDLVRKLKIECVQVDRVAKDTTDKYLMIEAIQILLSGDIKVFIIVSGDADFRQLCEHIKQNRRKVIGIGGRGQTSPHLQKSCDTFHYIEDLEETLIQLEEKAPPPEFKDLLFRALALTPSKHEGWVPYTALGEKLRELDPELETRFGRKKLSARLREFSDQLDINGHMVRVRVIDAETIEPVTLLRQACIQAQRADGKAHIGQIGEMLRKLDSQFESRFGQKKLSKWLQEYPHIFKQHEEVYFGVIE